MKLNLRNFQKSITFLLVFFMVVSNAQNAIVGTGFAGAWPGACNSVSGATYLSANIGTTFGSTGLTPNGTGNQYWRLGIDWSGSIYQINNGGTTDALVAPNTTYNAAVTCQGSGALYYNVPNASYRYVFKTLNGGVSPTGTWVFFEVQGTVQNVSSVSASPSAASPVNMPVTVTATTSGALSTGQAVYLRYTTNAWSTSTVVPMTGSGATYNATIPGFAAGTNVSYYVFTSAPTSVATNGSNADLYTMTY